MWPGVMVGDRCSGYHAGVRRAYVISHWDLDGLSSAALVCRAYGEDKCRVRLSSVTAISLNLKHFISKESIKRAYTDLYLLDLNPQQDSVDLVLRVIQDIKALNIRIHWYDHHEWGDELKRRVSELGVDVVNDVDSVTAEITMEKLNLSDEYSAKLTDLAIDDDKFINRYELTTYWRRILKWFNWDVRYRALESFKAGDLWPKWAQELYDEMKHEYEKLLEEAYYSTIVIRVSDEVSVALSSNIDRRVHAGDVQAYLIDKGIAADAYIVMYPNSISLRSSSIDVSTVAKELGGGGHRGASGIPILASPQSTISRVISILSSNVLRSHY